MSQPINISSTDFEKMIWFAPYGMLKLSLKGEILFCNKKMDDIIGVPSSLMIGKNYLDFYKNKTNTGYHYWVNLFENEALPKYHGWMDVTLPSGIIKSVSISLQMIYTNDGKPDFYLVILEDIADEQQTQQHIYEERVKYQQDIAGAIINAQENERKHLAEELHDNINQLLATTKLFIDSARNAGVGNAGELLQKSSDNIDNIINELRYLSKSLIPPAIYDIGLIEPMRNLVSDIEMLSGIAINLDIIHFTEADLSNEKKLVIYRILQEQLNNILKHADAKNIYILLSRGLQFVQLIIEDDGKGFDINKTSTGLGLKNIKSRVALYNGRVNIVSSPGQGCRMMAQIECERGR